MSRSAILLLFLITLLVYSNALNCGFVFDDNALVVNNPLIKSPELFKYIFKSGIYDHWLGPPLYDRMYRPLQALSYALDYKIWGLNPFGFHLTSVFIHFLNGILLYFLLFFLFKNQAVSWLAAVFFLVHPVNTSVVTYVAGRADILNLFFNLLSVLFFIKFLQTQARKMFTFSIFFALLALLSRENSLILFIFIALVIFIFRVRPRYYFLILPFLLLDSLYLIFRLIIFGPSGLAMHPADMPIFYSIINFLNILPRYLELLVFPVDLRLFRVTLFVRQIFEMKIIVPMLFIALYVLAIFRFRHNRLIIFSLFWFLIGLLPVFILFDNFISLGQAMMAESWVYIASIGFFTGLAYFLSRLRKWGKLLALFLAFIYSLLTIYNNSFWKNETIFYKRVLSYSQEANPLRQKLIDAYLKDGRYKEALGEIKKLSFFYPDTVLLDISWGNYYYSTNQLQTALNYYDKIAVKSFWGDYRVSSCYIKLRKLDKAIDFALASFRLNPYFVPNLIQLGDIYFMKGNTKESRKYYLIALRFDPKNPELRSLVKNMR
ncbi:MAG: hypothetical protein NTW13_06010 [Candidatus Omnitrophica bacterium]|nr:hypothetical protein [Candidatus Omnitrophota bacterium]